MKTYVQWQEIGIIYRIQQVWSPINWMQRM